MLLTFDTKNSSKSSKAAASSSTSSSSALNKSSDGENKVIQNVILQYDKTPDAKVFQFTQRKSKGGCITCKIRKKRCSEEQPICADCKRLGKNCVWATDDMSIQQIRQLKKKVEQDEEQSRVKRKLEFQTKKTTKKHKSSNTTPSNSATPSTTLLATSDNDNGTTNDFTTKYDTINNTETKDSSTASVRDEVRQVNYEEVVGLKNLSTDNDHKRLNSSIPNDTIQDQSPVDAEVFTRGQTPITANLLYLSQNSPPGSPKWDNISIPSPGSTAQFFEQFNSFIESNMRSMRSHSGKTRTLDDEIIGADTDEEGELEDVDQNQHQNQSPNSLIKGLSPFLGPFDTLNDHFPYFELQTLQPSTQNTLNLDRMGLHLYDYYINRLSGIVSIVPPELNYYTKVFLPMAAVNPGILNSILAWSAYHIGSDYEAEGDKYMQKALTYIDNTPIQSDSQAIQRLANLLILIGTEVCRGDVTKWGSYMKLGAKVIKDRGGLYKFNKDQEQRWLISSFSYHDILASSTSERGTYFPVDQYEDFLVNQFGFGVDPLQGIVKPLFNIIGEISTLASETKRLLKISSDSLGYGIMNDDDDNGEEVDESSPDSVSSDQYLGLSGSPDSGNGKKVTRYASLLVIMQKASSLETKINAVKPDPEDLESFSPEELELQLTLFELFQFTAKLHLRQSVLRLNPSSLETQFILCELLKCLDIVLKSSVEGSLCFPLFIAGMNCTTKKDRKMMVARFDDILGRYSFKNIDRAKTIMQKVWEVDPTGTRCVDWYEIIKRLDWDLSFA